MRRLRIKILISLLVCACISSARAQSWRPNIDSLNKKFAVLVLTDSDLNSKSCTTFIGHKETALKIIQSLLNDSSLTSLRTHLIDIHEMLNQVKFSNNSRSLYETRAQYHRFVAARETFRIAWLQFETDLIVNNLGKSINTVVKKTKEDLALQMNELDCAIQKVYSISNTINNFTRDTVNSLRDTLKTMLTYHSPLYVGINWFTQNGLGMGAHYHFTHKRIFSPLAGFTLLYRWNGPDAEQDNAHNYFGMILSAGASVRLSQYNRLGLMAELSLINNEAKAGGRLMAYNQHLAIGMGYSEYMGADITLMIRFHDPRR